MLTRAIKEEFHLGILVVWYGVIKGRNRHDPFKDNQNDWVLYKELVGN